MLAQRRDNSTDVEPTYIAVWDDNAFCFTGLCEVNPLVTTAYFIHM